MNRILELNPAENTVEGSFLRGDIVLIKCDAVDEAFTVTMPTATGLNDVWFIIKKIDSSANAVTISFFDDENADGLTALTLSNQYDAVTLIGDQDNYHKIVNIDQALLTTSSPTFTGLTISGLTEGSIPFIGASGVISQDNANLFWDDTNKRLGIGTATPVSDLEIYKSSANPILTITGAHDTDYDPQIQFRTDATPAVQWSMGVDAATDLFILTPNTGVGGSDADSIYFNGSLGSLGLGIDPDIYDFRIARSGASTYCQYEAYSTTAGHMGRIRWKRSRSATIGTPLATQSGDSLGTFTFQGVNSSNSWEEGAFINVYQVGAAGTRVPTTMEFVTCSSTGLNSNQFTLCQNGNIGFGGIVTPIALVHLKKSSASPITVRIENSCTGGHAHTMNSAGTSHASGAGCFYMRDSTDGVNYFQYDSGTGYVNIPLDYKYFTIGAGNDAGMMYDGTDMIINTDLVGSGSCKINSLEIDKDGFIKPITSADASAPNNSIYYSSTQSKLVYKDSGGTVNNLY